jgi:hypothetical protein
MTGSAIECGHGGGLLAAFDKCGKLLRMRRFAAMAASLEEFRQMDATEMSRAMDQAWKLEQESWEAARSGRSGEFFARHMTTDAFVVMPGTLISRDRLILGWGDRKPLDRYQLAEPKMVLVDGESVLISYRVSAHAEWLPDYEAQVSALYTWSGGEWALAFRQHTPDGQTPFEF